MEILMKDIQRRISDISERSVKEQSINIQTMYNKAFDTGSEKLVESVLLNWKSLNNDTNLAFTNVMELFEKFYETSSNNGSIRKMCNIICEDAIPKVRTGVETQNYIKHKLSRFKTKVSTKINNNVDNMKDAVSNTLSGAKSNLDKNVNQIKNNVGLNKEEEKDKTIKECYEKMLEHATKIVLCDRLLTNHDKLSKRFNIDKMVSEMSKQDVSESVYEMCKLIDTYNMSFKAKYNIALENTIYVLEKNYIKYDKKDIVKYVTEYFLMMGNTDSIEYKSIIENMISVLGNNRFYNESDLSEVEYLINAKDTDIQFDLFFNSEEDTFSSPLTSIRKEEENSLLSENSYYVSDINYLLETNKINEVKKLMDDFKIGVKNKTPESVKVLIKKIYSKSANNIIEETPNFLNWIRVFFVLSTFTINPVLGLVTTFTDYFISMTVKRSEAEKMVDKYKKEKDKAKKKLESLNSADSKKRCEEYIKVLDKSIDKLERYHESLLTEEEIDVKRDKEFDLNFGDDFKFESSDIKNLSYIQLIESDIEYLKDTNEDIILDDIKMSISKFDLDDLDTIVDLSMNTFGGIISKDKLKSTLEECIPIIREEIKETDNFSKIMAIDCLKENIYKLNNSKDRIFNEDYSISESFNLLHQQVEFIKNVNEILDYYKNNNSLMEASFTNSLKLAREKLKKSAVKLSDKEKSASKAIDVSMSNMHNSMERALTNGNREAVIRGSVLPSASKIIKTAIATGTVALISPAIAVIGFLGSLAVSKKLKAKERQLILDEIEIELKMVEKYLKIAEDKDDMKATRQLLNTQRRLERERQRIKYNMAVHHKTAPDIKDNDD